MQIRALIMLAVALVLGGITVFLVNNFLRSEVGDHGRVQKCAPCRSWSRHRTSSPASSWKR